jgi:acyl carrier protein
MAIRLMLALEREFDVEFPPRMLNRQSMSSIDAIGASIAELEQRQALPKAA